MPILNQHSNSKWKFWRFYSRYFPRSPVITDDVIYNGLGASGGTYADVLNGQNASYSSFTDQINGGSSANKTSPVLDLYTGLGAAGGTYADVITGVTSSTATSYTLTLQGGNS